MIDIETSRKRALEALEQAKRELAKDWATRSPVTNDEYRELSLVLLAALEEIEQLTETLDDYRHAAMERGERD